MAQGRSSQPNDALNEIVSSRVLSATREVLFQAFSEPTRLAQWWALQGFTNEFHEFDFRPGGAWKLTMRGPDGTTHRMDNQFAEIVRPERIVLRHFQPGHGFTLVMSFTIRGDHTELTWQMRFDDPAEADWVRAFVLPANDRISNEWPPIWPQPRNPHETEKRKH